MRHVPDLLASAPSIATTPLAVEVEGLQAGAPWSIEPVAGLQFYTYDMDDGLEGRVRPLVGDRLHLMRRPDNRADRNAIEVWWKNEFHIGHLSREIAATVAPLMDAGKPVRAYVIEPGDGCAWSLRALLVGEAVKPLHDRFMGSIVRDAWRDLEIQGENGRAKQAGRHFEVRDRIARRHRLRQAVAVLSKVPFEPDLPSIGSNVDPYTLAKALGVSQATTKKMVRRLGKPSASLGFTVTPALKTACLAFAAAPKPVPTADIREAYQPSFGWIR